MKKILLKKEIQKLMKKFDSWTLNTKNTQLSKTFIFSDHINALVFIARITVHAQVLNHHPDIEFSYKKVKITLTTHNHKGLTKIDFDLAKKIDSIKISG
jgi:4a-hydroxytetrahydrobiopterin dehydratase